jgi:dihydroneopterin aldolase
VQIKADDKATQSDKIQDAIDYDVIIDKIKNVINNNSIQLIEKLVSNVLDEIMNDKRIQECTLEIDKLGVYDFLDSFSVTQTRKNDSANR